MTTSRSRLLAHLLLLAVTIVTLAAKWLVPAENEAFSMPAEDLTLEVR